MALPNDSPRMPRERLLPAYTHARQALLDELAPSGHWIGELSASALSTATAVMALEMARRHGRVESVDGAALRLLIDRGLDWLARHQNADGGWGDTTKSVSNISTTMLARAVLRATGTEDRSRTVVDEAVGYIDRAGGVPAVVARYGRDRTFSVPILTHCALAGLVDWKQVPPLPFELACLPARFYKTVRLPVVSYALPALIAIGQARHHHRRPWNPIARAARAWAAEPSLRVLDRIQPENGGFLEATPLTSFVTMSLAAMGLARHPVAERGLRFIVASVRPDGSWPIDTNLATWVTTLSVNALGDDLPVERREPILRWLLDQQYTTVHTYTNADPGGWAWTDLPGGVPDADDTPGALLAILRLQPQQVRGQPSFLVASADELAVRARGALRSGVDWLVGLQNRNGGWPTFCRGWGTLPFDRSAADISAHCLRALARVQSMCVGRLLRSGIERGNGRTEPAPFEEFPSAPVSRAIDRGFDFLRTAQRADGAWLPLWFGNQRVEDDENPTYGTARVLAAYRDASELGDEVSLRGLSWLRFSQNPDGGWGAGPGTPSSVEETALAVEVLLSDPGSRPAAHRGLAWLIPRVEDGSFREPSPIGFYFAKLWYFERLYPLIFAVAALRVAARQGAEGDGERAPPQDVREAASG
jgi:squalene-hopene/tetraprenyl-beta-curcumene cyclase